MLTELFFGNNALVLSAYVIGAIVGIIGAYLTCFIALNEPQNSKARELQPTAVKGAALICAVGICLFLIGAVFYVPVLVLGIWIFKDDLARVIPFFTLKEPDGEKR